MKPSTLPKPFDAEQGTGPRAVDDAALLPDDTELHSPDQLLSQALSQLDDERAAKSKLTFYRIVEGQPDVLLCDYTPSEFASKGGFVKVIGMRYGSGIYRVRVHDGKGIVTHKRMAFEAPPGWKPPAEVEVLPALNTDLGSIMMQGFTKLGELIMQAAQRPPEKSLVDQAKDLVVLRDLFMPPVTAIAKQPDMVEQIERLQRGVSATRDLNEMLGGESSGGGTLGAIIKQVLPAIIPAILAAAQKHAPAAGTAVVPAGAAEQPLPDNVVDMNKAREAEIRRAFKFLLDKAARDLPAETYADVVCDSIPDTELQTMLGPANWFETLAGFEPQISNFKPWFTKLRDAVIANLTPEQQP